MIKSLKKKEKMLAIIGLFKRNKEIKQSSKNLSQDL